MRKYHQKSKQKQISKTHGVAKPPTYLISPGEVAFLGHRAGTKIPGNDQSATKNKWSNTLDLDRGRCSTWLTGLSSTYREGNCQVAVSWRVANKVDKDNTDWVAIFVDAEGRGILVAIVSLKIKNLGLIRIAKDFSHNERRIIDRSNGPLMEIRLVSWRSWEACSVFDRTIQSTG